MRVAIAVVSVLLLGCGGPEAPQPMASPAAPPATAPSSAPTAASEAQPAPPPTLAAVASSPESAGAPGCGGLGPGVTEANARTRAATYYERTLRSLVQAWGPRAWQGAQAATAAYVVSMAKRTPTIERVTRSSGAAARATVAALGASRPLVCGSVTALGDRPLLIVSLYLNGPPPVPPDSGVWLDAAVDPTSGEVLAVWHMPLG